MSSLSAAILDRRSFPTWIGILGCIFLALAATTAWGQIPDPSDSSKVLNLTTFATILGAGANSDAIDLTHAKDGTGRVFVSRNPGTIHAFSSTGTSLGTFLDLNTPGAAPDFDSSVGFTTRGLSFTAFHPDYANAGTDGEGKLYTVYRSLEPGLNTPDYSQAAIASRPGNVVSQFVIAEWTVDAGNPNLIDHSSRREVLRVEFSGPSEDGHQFGEIAFNPFANPGDDDYGNLYIAVGDGNSGGGTNFPYVQTEDNPFGKILRLNPLQNGGDPYSVPLDNPFNNGGTLLDNDGVTEEIAAYGFRNPQGFSFAQDSFGDTRIVSFDIGNNSAEEVNLVDIFDNHGWPRFEGPLDSDLGIALNLPPGSTLEEPAAALDHTFPNLPGDPPSGGGTAITGGFVISDPTDPTFQDQVIFGDLSRSAFFHASFEDLVTADATDTQAAISVMAVSIDGSPPGLFEDLIGASRGDARFGVDEAGRLFVVSRRTNSIFLTDFVANQSAVVVPEPSTLCLAFSALFCIGVVAFRKRLRVQIYKLLGS